MVFLRKFLVLTVLLSINSVIRGQGLQEGTPEFECAKTWSTGYEYWKNKEFERALPFLRKTVACDKKLRPATDDRKFGSAFEKLADSYVNLSKVDSAILSFKWGYTELKNDRYVYKIGELFVEKQQFDSAAAYYRKYYNLTKQASELKRIAGMWITAAKYETAIDVYEEYLALDPTDKEIWDYLLVPFKTFYVKYKGEEAWLKKCEAYSEQFPKASKDFYISIKLQKQLVAGEYEEVIRIALNILKTDSTSVETWKSLAKAYDALEKRSDAIEATMRAMKLAPQDSDLICNLAQLYLDAGNFAKAWTLCNQALAIREFGRPYYLIGDAIIDGISRCSGNKLTIVSKEAYMVAYKYYMLAAKYPDVEANAKARASYALENGPTKSDCFMGSLGKLNSAACYGWMIDRNYNSPCK